MKNEISTIIGERINKLLSTRKVKQKDLAAALGIAENIVSYFVSGKRMPNTVLIKNIAEFFDVSADYLLGLSEMPTDIKTKQVSFQLFCDYVNMGEADIRRLRDISDGDRNIICVLLKEFESRTPHDQA